MHEGSARNSICICQSRALCHEVEVSPISQVSPISLISQWIVCFFWLSWIHSFVSVFEKKIMRKFELCMFWVSSSLACVSSSRKGGRDVEASAVGDSND